MYLAHSKNAEGKDHDLCSHLRLVAEKATAFAVRFGCKRLAHWVGLA